MKKENDKETTAILDDEIDSAVTEIEVDYKDEESQLPIVEIMLKRMKDDVDFKKATIKLLLSGSDEDVEKFLINYGYDGEDIASVREEILDKTMGEQFDEDVLAIKKRYPFVTADLLKEDTNFKNYAKYRGYGLPPIESFEVSCPYIIAKNLREEKGSINYMNHMVPLGVKSKNKKSLSIPKDELPIWKSAFPKDSLASLTERYNKSIK